VLPPRLAEAIGAVVDESLGVSQLTTSEVIARLTVIFFSENVTNGVTNIKLPITGLKRWANSQVSFGKVL
jgi:hypothetical protein